MGGKTRPKAVAFLADYSPRHWRNQDACRLGVCRALKERNIESVVVYSEELTNEVSDVMRANGVKTATLSLSKGLIGYYRGLARLVREHSIEMAQIEYFDYFAPVAWLARLAGMRQIVFMDRNSGEWRPTSWKSHLVRLRARLACRPMTHLIAISDFIRNRLVMLGVAPQKITRVYLGVDLERYAPDPAARGKLGEALGFGSEDLIIAAVMQLLPWKHPAVVVESCGLLAKRGIPVRLLMAGDGPLRTRLEVLSRELGIGDRVHWLGHYARPERVMQASDVFVLPSVGEAFGLVLAEAMACGLPVVGSRSGAIGEVVEDGTTGLLVTPQSPEAFADAMEKLADDVSLRRRMGAAGRERAQRLFSVETHVRNMLKVYEAVWRQRA
jgi:glycosyltransferase involved in cell wall biosynthesis